MENLHVNVVEIVRLSHDATIPMRIAQLIIEKYQVCCLKVVNKLSETSRGASGFGSTGYY